MEGGEWGGRKTGQDADICKRSDTDLEKASSSAWLVNRSVKLPRGSQSAGENLRPTDSTCTFLLLMFTARRSLEMTGKEKEEEEKNNSLFFLSRHTFIFVCASFFFCFFAVRIGAIRTEHFFWGQTRGR